MEHLPQHRLKSMLGEERDLFCPDPHEGPTMKVVQHSDRTMMWHEAGHAVVAMHFGVKVRYYGLDPLPHCLVSTGRLNKHQKGVLMCAGAEMTRVVTGVAVGGWASDYPMAQTLGDLDVFMAEAQMLCRHLTPQAKYLVEARLGKLGQSTFTRSYYGADTCPVPQSNLFDEVVMSEEDVRPLEPQDAHYKECVEAGEKAKLGKTAKKLVYKLATFQMQHPQFVAKYLGI